VLLIAPDTFTADTLRARLLALLRNRLVRSLTVAVR